MSERGHAKSYENWLNSGPLTPEEEAAFSIWFRLNDWGFLRDDLEDMQIDQALELIMATMEKNAYR